MQQPTRLISTPFAQEGEKTEIQNVTGEFDNSATYRLGFPPLTMQSIRLGGKPPKGTDFNGILFDITENISFLCKGGRYQYNAGLSTLIGGYPEGSNLLLDDNVTEVVSTVAGNQNNPNINMTGWILKPNRTTAANVADASGETQQQVNYNGGSKWHSRVGGYLENERVVLANGDIVKSTIDGNTNDPNVDMTGWVFENILTLASIYELSDKYGVGAIAFVKDTASFYVYDASSSAISVNGWSLIHDNTIKTKSLNIQDGADITSLIEYASSNNIFVELERSRKFTTTVFDLDIQKLLIGDGSVQFIYDYLANDNTENVAPKIATPNKKDSIYGWYDSVQARGNFEHGAGRGLIVNDYGARPQICGFRTKQQQKNYPSVDIVGQYTHVMSPKVETLTNCTFTANSVTSASITSALDIKVGDFISTEGDHAIGKPWRSEVTAIDLVNNKLSVTWWLHESGGGEGIPPNGLSCYTPYVNGLWGENTNVFIRDDDKVTTVIGYELGVATEKTRDKFSQIVGHYVVNLSSNTARAQTAYKVGGKWDQALLVDDCTAAVVTSGLGKYAVDYTANTDLDSAAVIMRSPFANGGNLSRSVSGLDVLYNVDFAGVQSALKLSYSIHSADMAYNGLQPSLCIGANSGGVAHTTTISTVRMFAGHILEFKQLEAVNWTIIAGGNTFVLNSSGAMDYLKLLYDGNFFIKMFAGKSL